MAEKKIRFGIVGPGTIGHFHAQAIGEIAGAELVSVLGRDSNKTMRFAELYGIESCTEPEEFFAKGKIDAVTIATPSGAHLEVAEFAAARGIHVLCEKPLEVTPEKCRKLIESCRKEEVRLGLIFQGRLERCALLAKRAIDEGRLGKILLASCQMRWSRSQEYYDSAAWRGTWALDGGGCLMNQGIHSIDLLLYLAGDVQSVSAFQGPLTHENIEVEDNICGSIRFLSGAIGTFETSTSCGPGFPRRIEISGDKGTICIEDNRIVRWEFVDPHSGDEGVVASFSEAASGKGGAADPTAIDISGHRKIIENFAQSLLNGCEARIPGGEGSRSVAFIDSIYRSMRQGGAPISVIRPVVV